MLNLVYWVIGQGVGGILTGQATDPNAAPLFVLLAAGLYALTPVAEPGRSGSRERTAARLSPAAHV